MAPISRLRVKNYPMCYHTALIARPDQLARRFGRSDARIRDFRPMYHISAFTHAEYPVVTDDEQFEYFRWGLIPFWTRGIDDALTIRNRTINARSESVFTKPSFREPIRKRRCLVPASGYFDWRHDGGRKIPYYITLKDRPLFAFAGIYDSWRNPVTGEEVPTFSILTTRANRLMSFIHNTNFRMPVILRREDEETWLDPSLTQRQVDDLLQSYPDREMQGRTIGNDFLRKSPYDRSILDTSDPEPVEPAQP